MTIAIIAIFACAFIERGNADKPSPPDHGRDVYLGFLALVIALLFPTSGGCMIDGARRNEVVMKCRCLMAKRASRRHIDPPTGPDD